jgi:hypothetical protein
MLVQLGNDLRFQDDAYPQAGTWTLVDFDDWYATADPSFPVDKNPLGVGDFPPPPATWSGKYMDLVADVWVGEGQDVRTWEWRRLSALRLAPVTVTVTDSFGTLTSQVQLAEAVEFQLGDVPRYARVTFHLYAPDPLTYGPTREFLIPAVRPVADGLHFPLFSAGKLDFGEWPVTAGFGPGKFAFSNFGTEESWPWFEAAGYMEGGFTIISGDDEIRYEDDVPTNKTLLLSPYAGGRAILDGVDVTTNLVSPAWSPIQPGDRRGFTFSPLGSASGGAALIPRFREAYA